VKLVRLAKAIEPAVREIAAEYREAGIARFEEIERDYDGMVERLAAAEREGAPGAVPFSFLLAERDDGRLVGTIRVRHRLNDRLWQNGGNIGYDVRPSMRNRGYATRMLALALEEAFALGLDWVLLTVDPGNRPSIRVIEKNGGRPFGVADATGYLRYRIDPCDSSSPPSS
jgi:predicted acetyltransferase